MLATNIILPIAINIKTPPDVLNTIGSEEFIEEYYQKLNSLPADVLRAQGRRAPGTEPRHKVALRRMIFERVIQNPSTPIETLKDMMKRIVERQEQMKRQPESEEWGGFEGYAALQRENEVLFRMINRNRVYQKGVLPEERAGTSLREVFTKFL